MHCIDACPPVNQEKGAAKCYAHLKYRYQNRLQTHSICWAVLWIFNLSVLEAIRLNIKAYTCPLYPTPFLSLKHLSYFKTVFLLCANVSMLSHLKCFTRS